MARDYVTKFYSNSDPSVFSQQLDILEDEGAIILSVSVDQGKFYVFYKARVKFPREV